jgi:hypothetical protein
MIAATKMILQESTSYCPYIREIQKASRRNAEIEDNDKQMDNDFDMDIPEATRLKAHLKRRVERQTKNKWVQYATEYASEIILAGPERKNEIRNYMDMVRESVMAMDQKDKDKRNREKTRRLRTHEKHAF